MWPIYSSSPPLFSFSKNEKPWFFPFSISSSQSNRNRNLLVPPLHWCTHRAENMPIGTHQHRHESWAGVLGPAVCLWGVSSSSHSSGPVRSAHGGSACLRLVAAVPPVRNPAPTRGYRRLPVAAHPPVVRQRRPAFDMLVTQIYSSSARLEIRE